MRALPVLLLMLVMPFPAGASFTGRTADAAKPAGPGYVNPDGPRQGGDTVASALPITAIPYHDTGTTAGYVNDYDEVCPFSGSTSPDVVYRYDATADACVDVDLCASGYDTKVYVYENAVGNLIACNDDFDRCGYSYRSKLESVAFTSGNTYYVVVDGYGGLYGTYDLTISPVTCPPDPPPAPPIDCPAGALSECEPSCVDGYYDAFNSGCGGLGWTLLEGQDGTGCATMCARACTFLWHGGSYRDSDWYRYVAGEGGVAVTAVAEFPLQIILIYGPAGGIIDCMNFTLLFALGDAGVPVSVSHAISPGTEAWFWVGPSIFTELPESRYTFTICGIENGPTPAYDGACCSTVTGSCSILSAIGCASVAGLYLGNCVPCEPNPCPPPVTGACCLADGSCLLLTLAGCAQALGSYLGNDTACTPGACDEVPVVNTSWGVLKSRYR